MSSRTILFLALASALGVSAASATEAAAPADVLKIELDQAKVAKAPVGTVTLVVGNPAIADVTMLKGGVGMIITGKGYGRTNLVAIDAQGNVIDEKQIQVDPTRDVLVVQRGNARVSYVCNPTCMPSVQLGDESGAFGEASGQISARNGLASGAITAK
jgi:Flp pilus assembly secretin CpaC